MLANIHQLTFTQTISDLMHKKRQHYYVTPGTRMPIVSIVSFQYSYVSVHVFVR